MRQRLSLTLLALAALAAGCVKKNTDLVEPYALCAMPDDCTFGETCSAQYIGAPTLDVAAGTEMWLAIEMHNQLANNGVEGGQANTHDAHFESYSLGYSNSGGLLPPSTGDMPSTGSSTQQVIPAEGTSVVGIYPFPQVLVDELAASTEIPTGPNYVTVTVNVKFKGTFQDGSHWEAPMDIPVRLCRNCVYLGCDDPTQTAIAACPSLHQFPAGAPTCG